MTNFRVFGRSLVEMTKQNFGRSEQSCASPVLIHRENSYRYEFHVMRYTLSLLD